MALVGAGRGEFTQFVTDHVFGYKYWNVLSSIVDSESVSDHLGDDRGPSAPRFDEFLFVGCIHFLHLFHEVVVHEVALL